RRAGPGRRWPCTACCWWPCSSRRTCSPVRWCPRHGCRAGPAPGIEPAPQPRPLPENPRPRSNERIPTMTTPPAQSPLGADIELEIGGMTCASCANRAERKLNKLGGVTAAVNYATEKARVSVPEGYDPQELITVVEQTGYTAALPAPARTAPADADGQDGQDGQEPEDPELTSLRHRLIGAVLLAVPGYGVTVITATQ